MPTSVFYNNFQASQEQNLLEDLIIESIRIYGNDVYYIPRKLNNYDEVYGADDISTYENAILIEMYIKSYDGFKGDGNFMSKFGLQIRDQVVFVMSRRVFEDEVSQVTGQERPNEGDVIYFPMNNRCFQIKFVEKYQMFYPLGSLYTWEVTCELLEYAGEQFNTGVAEIDNLFKDLNLDAKDFELKDETGAVLTDEEGNPIISEKAPDVPGDDYKTIEAEDEELLDWSIIDPFSEGKI